MVSTNLPTDESPYALLKSAVREAGLAVDLFPQVAAAMAVFFDGKDADRVRYVSELAMAPITFLALSLDPRTQHGLLASLPSLSIFVDTNIIYRSASARMR